MAKMTRYDVINHLIQKNNYLSYLEIGVAEGDCFKQVMCNIKHSVDPSYPATYYMTSDKFFADEIMPGTKYDIIFIDGEHGKRGVWRDITNSLKHISENGIILVHDCNPPSEKLARKKPKEGRATWYGDGFKTIMILRSQHDDVFVRTIDTDCGIGVIKPVKEKQPLIKISNLTYKIMDANRKYSLGLISVDEFKGLEEI